MTTMAFQRRKWRKLRMLAKIEDTYGTDAVPTDAANGVRITNVTFTPVEGDEVKRDLMLPYLGNQGVDLAGIYGKIEGDIELAGSGTPGTAPAWGVLARMCAKAETITAGVDVVYSPISSNEEAGTVYWHHDGVLHVLLGVRGKITGDVTAKKHPILKVSLSGLLGTITDESMTTPILTAFKKPIIVSKAATTLTIGGVAMAAESFQFDYGETVTPSFLIGSESIEITDRSATGTAVVLARALSEFDPFAKALAPDREAARVAVRLTHGTTAGNIIQIDAPAVEIGKPSPGQTDGVMTYSLPLSFCPVAGDDELTITVK